MARVAGTVPVEPVAREGQTLRYTAVGLVLALLCAGCATPYQPRGFTGGYSNRRIDASTFHVSFKGNGYTPRQTVETAAMRR